VTSGVLASLGFSTNATFCGCVDFQRVSEPQDFMENRTVDLATEWQKNTKQNKP